jgi:hypothetical protein
MSLKIHHIEGRFTQKFKTLLGWLRHNATSRKAAGSIPDEVIGFFN